MNEIPNGIDYKSIDIKTLKNVTDVDVPRIVEYVDGFFYECGSEVGRTDSWFKWIDDKPIEL